MIVCRFYAHNQAEKHDNFFQREICKKMNLASLFPTTASLFTHRSARQSVSSHNAAWKRHIHGIDCSKSSSARKRAPCRELSFGIVCGGAPEHMFFGRLAGGGGNPLLFYQELCLKFAKIEFFAPKTPKTHLLYRYFEHQTHWIQNCRFGFYMMSPLSMMIFSMAYETWQRFFVWYS